MFSAGLVVCSQQAWWYGSCDSCATFQASVSWLCLCYIYLHEIHFVRSSSCNNLGWNRNPSDSSVIIAIKEQICIVAGMGFDLMGEMGRDWFTSYMYMLVCTEVQQRHRLSESYPCWLVCWVLIPHAVHNMAGMIFRLLSHSWIQLTG